MQNGDSLLSGAESRVKAGFHLCQFGRTIARPVFWACVVCFNDSFHSFIFYFLSTVAPSICIDCFTGGRAKIHISYKFKT